MDDKTEQDRIDEKNKTKEMWLREEFRVSRTQMLTLVNWGVTVLAAAEVNLFYIRREVTKYLVEQKFLQPDELLPFSRWFRVDVPLLTTSDTSQRGNNHVK
jgi:hypothetical protein